MGEDMKSDKTVGNKKSGVLNATKAKLSTFLQNVKVGFVPDDNTTGYRNFASRIKNLWKSGIDGRLSVAGVSTAIGFALGAAMLSFGTGVVMGIVAGLLGCMWSKRMATKEAAPSEPRQVTAMRNLRKNAYALVVLGIIWTVVAFNMDVSVTSEAEYIPEIGYIEPMTVVNLHKMENRRNHIWIGGLITACGVILVAVVKHKEIKG